ncbi:hypothetical protein AMJ80_09275 [bacterium SM23_31]|nr:MAG: hypothetical protein AMJ80_09275 [bacterium SM23_31]
MNQVHSEMYEGRSASRGLESEPMALTISFPKVEKPPKFLDQVRYALRTRHYSFKTEKAYIRKKLWKVPLQVVIDLNLEDRLTKLSTNRQKWLYIYNS